MAVDVPGAKLHLMEGMGHGSWYGHAHDRLNPTIEAIIAQQLLPIPGERGRVVATEILIANLAVRKIIRTKKTEQIMTVIQTGFDEGMISMDRSLKNLYQQGLISYDDALAKCNARAK